MIQVKGFSEGSINWSDLGLFFCGSHYKLSMLQEALCSQSALEMDKNRRTEYCSL